MRSCSGDLLPGSADDPSISMRSIHHFFKSVSGRPLIRPAWYYDVEQQGEGIADVTTHLIDLVFWQCFPENPVRYETDVEVLAASHWPTAVRAGGFPSIDGCRTVPALSGEVPPRRGARGDGQRPDTLPRKKGCTSAWRWSELELAERRGCLSSVVRGSRASIEVVQDETTGNVKSLYVLAAGGGDPAQTLTALRRRVAALQPDYPGLRVVETDIPGRFLVDLPVAARPGMRCISDRWPSGSFGVSARARCPHGRRPIRWRNTTLRRWPWNRPARRRRNRNERAAGRRI